MPTHKDIPLQSAIENEALVIRIGVGTLAFCALAKNGGPLVENLRVADAVQFAKDAMREMNRESETGATMLNKMLDAAMEEATDQGSTAIRELKRKPREL
jgi:hypothetical protein